MSKRDRISKTISLLDYDMDESSSDSDFHIDDDELNCQSGDSDASNDNDTDSDSSSSGGSSEEESDDSTEQLKELLAGDLDLPPNNNEDDKLTNGLHLNIKNDNNQLLKNNIKIASKSICCVCLGDRSDDSNEIIDCDGCGVSVHEGCYGVSDNVSISSTNSTCSTEPWFCEACRAGVNAPTCELCPVKGGIYKETDVGKWVHLICALYVPGVAFGEVDQLSSVTLFEMQYKSWGAKACFLCDNPRLARTGVCIGCDAGMCKTFFHVTCAQSAGFLIEAHHEDADAADPFYAHCKVHSDKECVKRRKRNFHTLQLNMQQKMKEKLEQTQKEADPAQQRIQRKLLKYQHKYYNHKQMKVEPWVPTQKMSRLLTTSASACSRLLAKAETMSIDVELLERQEAQIAALLDIRKKWHITPAMNIEFVGYFLDRYPRKKELSEELKTIVANNRSLSTEQISLRVNYDKELEKTKEKKAEEENLMAVIKKLHNSISILCPGKTLPNLINMDQTQAPPKTSTPPSRPISVPTAAALKMGVGFPLVHLGSPGAKIDSNRMLSTQVKTPSSPTATNNVTAVTPTPEKTATPTLGVHTFDCGICKRCNDQHLLAKCDTCKLHYHLGCLNPPLTRHPKKSKLYGWQCSECDKSDESDAIPTLQTGRRKSRTRFNKEGIIVPMEFNETPLMPKVVIVEQAPTLPLSLPPSTQPALPPKPITEEITLTSSAKSKKISQKRRSTDNSLVPQSKCAKTSLNKSFPATVASSFIQTPIAKKCKIALKSTPSKSLTKPIISKSTKPPTVIENAGQHPIHANLSGDEPLLLEMSSISNDTSNRSNYDPLALPVSDQSMEISPVKAARKQKRKDKHKNRNSSDSDKFGKEHKRKHKKKTHENSHEASGDASIPKIKIKFKTLPLPGEATPEAQFFYVPANMVRSAEEASRPSSVETIEGSATIPSNIEDDKIVRTMTSTPILTATTTATAVVTTIPVVGNNDEKLMTPVRKISPRKKKQPKSLDFPPQQQQTKTNTTPPNIGRELICCICAHVGSSSNSVTCDECRKNYHFSCLDPPVKKTPKIRGYSWHCADCDPTDDENKK